MVGEFSILAIHKMAPEDLWVRTKHYAGVDREFFDTYFGGRRIGYAIEIGSSIRYDEPLQLDEAFGLERPPQSFCYLDINK